MKKFDNKQFVVRCAAVSLALFVFAGHFAPVSGYVSREVWTFKEVRVFKKMDGRFGSVVRETFNIRGGSVDINLSGNIAGFCPGGAETLRFNWKFPDNIERVSRGGGVGVSLEAGQIGRGGTCQSALAARSYFFAAGCCATNPFGEKDKENYLIEGNRIYSIETPHVVAHPEFGGKTTGFAKIGVDDRLPNAEKPLAFFQISINVPTDPGGGWVRYVYIYERSGGSVNNRNPSVEYDTDRPGNDYKNFDLRDADFELCRRACEDDANCRAYTYVKPGVQGANARCWLKSTVPAAGSSRCCISGVKP